MNSEKYLRGFWCYSRDQENRASYFHNAMQGSLRAALGAISTPIEIFRDADEQTGIGQGMNWPRTIVRKISCSALFFWIQSPKALRSVYCQFEFDMFRAQAARIARRFSSAAAPLDPDELWGALVTPIRWADMHAKLWEELPPAIVEKYYVDWHSMQVSPELNLANGLISNDELSNRSYRAALSVSRQLLAALPAHVGLTDLVDFLCVEDAGFIEEWIDRFPRLGVLTPPKVVSEIAAQRALAAARTSSCVGYVHPRLGATFFLAPLADKDRGFWASATPLEGRLAAIAEASLPIDLKPELTPAGHLAWPQQAAGRIAEELRPLGVDLPDAEEARALNSFYGLDSSSRRQLGWRSPVGGFWSKGATSEPIAFGLREPRLPIMLTMPLT